MHRMLVIAQQEPTELTRLHIVRPASNEPLFCMGNMRSFRSATITSTRYPKVHGETSFGKPALLLGSMNYCSKAAGSPFVTSWHNAVGNPQLISQLIE